MLFINIHARSFSSLAVARKVREVPYLTREEYLHRSNIRKPVYMSECRGTPRREYPVNVIDGIRVEATFNPYQKVTKERRQTLATWKSRDWDNWDPYKCYFGVGGRQYELPEDLYVKEIEDKEDQLSPVLKRRAIADMKKQYTMNGIPWVWDKDFYKGKVHPKEKEPTLAKNNYTRNPELVRESLRNMDDMKLQHYQEKRDKKRYTWWERVIKTMGGEQSLEQYGRIQKIPRLQ